MSKIVDALAPYALLIRIALWVVLAGGLFVTGCRHGEKTATADASKRVSAANEVAANYLAAANACGQALSDVSDETRAAEKRAEEQKVVAEAAAAQAAKDTAAAQAKAENAARALQAAKATPTCAAQLAMTLCPEIPVL
jgi:transcriptional regulator of acetoin/glycerol metabolism